MNKISFVFFSMRDKQSIVYRNNLPQRWCGVKIRRFNDPSTGLKVDCCWCFFNGSRLMIIFAAYHVTVA